MRSIVFFVIFPLLSGCAGSDAQLRLLEHDNALRIDQVTGKPYDYTVRVVSVVDFGYDPSLKETRDDTALRAMKAQCPNAKIVGEETIAKPSVGPDYIIQIKCDGIPAPVEPPAPTKRRPTAQPK